MSADPKFDANRRLAELALWVDDGAHWIDQATVARAQRQNHGGDVVVTFDRNDLETFVRGLRTVATSMLGMAQPMPPLLPSSRVRPALRLVRSEEEPTR